jgi:hypothetical protein
MPGTTGSIEWRRPDPKTVELYNTDRAYKPPRDQPVMQDMYMQEMSGGQVSDRELERIRQQLEAELEQYKADENRFHTGGRPQTAAGLRQEARQHRRQLRGFDRYLKEGGTDLAGGFQELVESGAAWTDEDGNVYTAMPRREGDEEATQRILQAAREWGRMQDTLAKMMQQGATQDDLRRYMQSGGR